MGALSRLERFRDNWIDLRGRPLVQRAGVSGANAASPDFPTEHILISSTNSGDQDRAALEVVFHEACHFLTLPDSPLSAALSAAVRESGIAPGIDMVHAVHFYITGEAVRRALARAGEPPYTPYLYAVKLFGDRFRDAAARILPAYIDGTRTLRDAADDLARAAAPR